MFQFRSSRRVVHLQFTASISSDEEIGAFAPAYVKPFLCEMRPMHNPFRKIPRLPVPILSCVSRCVQSLGRHRVIQDVEASV